MKLAEDSLLCEFSPWFRGLSWDSYRLYCPKYMTGVEETTRVTHLSHFRTLSIPKAIAAKRVSQILLAVEFLEGNCLVMF